MNTKIKTSLIVFFSTLSLIFYGYISFAETTAQPEGAADSAKVSEPSVEKNGAAGTETHGTAPEKSEGTVEELTPPDAKTTDTATNGKQKMDSEAGVYYTVKKGDTLWDLSKRFNNNAWKWPGMWGDNKQLSNPHLIYPGQQIKLFYRDDMERLKKLRAEKSKKGKVSGMSPVKIDTTPDTGSGDKAGMTLPYYHYSKIGGIGFMSDNPAESHGYIFKVRGLDKIMIHKNDTVYIRETNDKVMIPGAKYFCYKEFTPSELKQRIKDANRLFGHDNSAKINVGYQHYMTGVVQIESKKSGYAVAKVIQSYRDISVNDKLIPFVVRSPDITLVAADEKMEGHIISSEEGEGEFGDDKVAFIDKGSDDGVKVGQMYNIFYPEEKASNQLFGGKKLYVRVEFASFLVLLTNPHSSTVLITSSEHGVSSGDGWHYPEK